MVVLTSNGTSSMLRTIKKNQQKENSARIMACMLRGISTSSQNYQAIDKLTSLEEDWLSKCQMEEDHNSSTSIKDQEPSNADSTTGHSTSIALEEATLCNSGAPTQDGGRSSNMMVPSSLTSGTKR